jgi:hypothetical protein
LLVAEGCLQGFQFAWDHKGDLSTISDRIQEIEEYMANPDLLAGPMKPNAHPRFFRDAYLAALKETVATIQENGDEVITESLAS